MDHVAAYEALNELLHVPSAETRYGAFRALRTRNAADPLVRGESLGGGFAYHVISSDDVPDDPSVEVGSGRRSCCSGNTRSSCRRPSCLPARRS